jgi:hypothetical protein
MKTLFALTLAIFLQTPQAQACSCREGTTADNFENADIVATAKVLTVKKEKGAGEEWPRMRVTLSPKLVWKGEPDDKLELFTADDSAACGFGFQKKKEYLLFVHRDEKGELHTSLCSGNGTVAGSRNAIDWLNKNHPIAK